jgi:organic radical activating enzyme
MRGVMVSIKYKDKMERKIIIWGCTKLALYVADKLESKYDVWICDNKEEQLKKVEHHKTIVGVDLKNIIDSHNDIVLICSKSSKNCYEIASQVENIGIENIAFIKPSVEKFGSPIDIDNGENIVWYCHHGSKNNVIPRIEINVIDGCNLKCEGCTHFSSLYSDDAICTIESFKKDLERLNEIGQIIRLRVLGGEPFLLDDIGEYIVSAREILPLTDIEIVTNGLLISKVSKKNWILIKDSNVGISISPYKPTIAIKDKIESVLKCNGINYSFEGENLNVFAKNLTLDKTHDGYISSRNCHSSGCIFLRNGKIYKCPFEGLIGDFYKYYGLEKAVSFEGIDIYGKDANLVYEEIKNIALNPVEMCSYCSEDMQYFEWRVNANPKLEDWLY